MTDVEKCAINVIVGNCQKMKCEIKGLVNMKMQGGQNGKYYPSPICTPISQEHSEHIKARIKESHDGGYLRQTNYQEKWILCDTRCR